MANTISAKSTTTPRPPQRIAAHGAVTASMNAGKDSITDDSDSLIPAPWNDHENRGIKFDREKSYHTKHTQP